MVEWKIYGRDGSIQRDWPGTRALFKPTGTSVKAVQTDLASYEGVEKLYAAIQTSGRRVDAVAINAGVGISGDFARDTGLQDELNLISLNVISPVHLTRRVVQDMLRSGGGRILYTSSIAGTMPGPFEAIYNASKALLTSFAQAVRNELKNTLMAGKDHVVAGSFKNKLQSAAGHALPDPTMAEMHRKQSEPGSANRFLPLAPEGPALAGPRKVVSRNRLLH